MCSSASRRAGAAATGTSASFLKTDDTTAGSWKGVYGVNGYTIASDSAAQFLDPRGGTGSVTVTAGATCAWTATSDAAWVTFSTGTGTGSGNAAFTVAPTTSTQRPNRDADDWRPDAHADAGAANRIAVQLLVVDDRPVGNRGSDEQLDHRYGLEWLLVDSPSATPRG